MEESEYQARLKGACSIAYIGDGARDLADLIGEIREVPGDIAEFGSYRGGTAMVMALASQYYAPPLRIVYAHDTFSGMPEVSEHDQHKPGDFGDIDEAKLASHWSEYQNLVLVRGDIRATANPPVFGELALAFIDCDLYEPTRASLPVAWEHLSAGGWLVIDDYNQSDCMGVKKAVDEFIEPRKLELTYYQAWRAIQKCMK